MMDRKQRILLVEDDSDIRQALADLLTVEGLEVVQCRDGADVKSFIDDIMLFDCPHPRVDACITDVRMPGMNGIAVLSYAQTLGWSLPTIVVTAYGDDEVRQSAAACGAIAVLDKPIDVDRLLHKLQAILVPHGPMS